MTLTLKVIFKSTLTQSEQQDFQPLERTRLLRISRHHESPPNHLKIFHTIETDAKALKEHLNPKNTLLQHPELPALACPQRIIRISSLISLFTTIEPSLEGPKHV
jgi:hypothetical protein